MAFGVSLVVLGLLGVPALLVAAIGAVVAAVAIGAFHRSLGGTPRRRSSHQRVPAKYVPSVLEGSSMRRRRIVHLRRHRHPSSPLRFR
ncbi:MAG TPA: hypothetical protein VHV53_04070 [Solirubrobacterales bacterium]|nr:hypothetical protein [Solirubrobacterales bacterium]